MNWKMESSKKSRKTYCCSGMPPPSARQDDYCLARRIETPLPLHSYAPKWHTKKDIGFRKYLSLGGCRVGAYKLRYSMAPNTILHDVPYLSDFYSPLS